MKRGAGTIPSLPPPFLGDLGTACIRNLLNICNNHAIVH